MCNEGVVYFFVMHHNVANAGILCDEGAPESAPSVVYTLH